MKVPSAPLSEDHPPVVITFDRTYLEDLGVRSIRAIA